MVDRFDVDTPVQRLAPIIGDAGPIGLTVAVAASSPNSPANLIKRPSSPEPAGRA